MAESLGSARGACWAHSHEQERSGGREVSGATRLETEHGRECEKLGIPPGLMPNPGWMRRTYSSEEGKYASRMANVAAAYSPISRITLHGLPAANTPSGMSRVTTLPEPITLREPMPKSQ